MTANQVIARALRTIGQLDAGETPSEQEASNALGVFNAMLAAWRLDRLTIPGLSRETFNLVDGTSSYTIGSGATFTRTLTPQAIEAAAYLPNGVSTEPEIPIAVYSDETWARLDKSLTGTLPQGIRYVKGASVSTTAVGTVHVYPIPDSSTPDLVLYIPTPFSGFATLTTDLAVSDGYEEAYVYNLAKRLAVEYGVALSAEARELTEESMKRIKGSNPDMSTLGLPSALWPMCGQGGYDITIDG